MTVMLTYMSPWFVYHHSSAAVGVLGGDERGGLVQGASLSYLRLASVP